MDADQTYTKDTAKNGLHLIKILRLGVKGQRHKKIFITGYKNISGGKRFLQTVYHIC